MNSFTSRFFGAGLALAISCGSSFNLMGQETAEKEPDPLGLFFGGKYEKCIEQVAPLLPKLSKPSEKHDTHLLALGGSYHYLGFFEEARPHLDNYHSLYGEKPFDNARLIAASYFRAANYSRLQEWTRSASLFDAFLKKYPDPEKNPYLPYALFDRANCHYAESEYDAALEKITRVEKKFQTLPSWNKRLR